MLEELNEGLGPYYGFEPITDHTARLLEKTLYQHEEDFIRILTYVRKFENAYVVTLIFSQYDSQEKIVQRGIFLMDKFAAMPQALRVQCVLQGAGLI